MSSIEERRAIRRQLRQDISDRQSKLTESEQKWKERGPFLESRGYRLRPRYRAGWKPSWLDNGIRMEFCDDWHMSMVSIISVFA